MERGYLVAALAVIATFTALSRGMQSLEHWSLIHVRHAAALARNECHADGARTKVRVLTHLRAHTADEAELLAKLHVPRADISAVTEEAVQRNMAAARCAQARAMREAERARSEMLRMQQQLADVPQPIQIEPLSLSIELPADVQRQIQRSSAIAAKYAAREVRLQMARHPRCLVPPSPPESQEQ